MWYLKKDMFCREHIFSDHSSFLKRSVRRPFLVGLAVVRRPADTFHVELVRASARISCAREILRSRARSHLAIACTIARTIFSIGPGFEPLALHVIDFYGSRVRIPARAARSFRGSRVRFPGPDRPFLGPVYPWPTSLAPTNGATGGTAEQKKLLSEVKKTCLHEWWPLLYGEVERYLLVTKA